MNSKQSNLNLQALLVPTVVAVAGLLFGCSDSPEPYQVEYVAPGAGGGVIPPADCDPPCRSGFSCVQGACVSSCNPDCPAGSLCVNGECETECNPPCSSGYSCVARVCTGSSDVQIYDYEEGNKPSEYGTFGTTWPKMSLTYSIANTPPGMSQEDVVAAVASATSKWHAVCLGLTFTPISGDNADIKFLFASLDHGDGVPFDGKGHILAHAFSPGEGRGGDVHFDYSGAAGGGIRGWLEAVTRSQGSCEARVRAGDVAPCNRDVWREQAGGGEADRRGSEGAGAQVGEGDGRAREIDCRS